MTLTPPNDVVDAAARLWDGTSSAENPNMICRNNDIRCVIAWILSIAVKDAKWLGIEESEKFIRSILDEGKEVISMAPTKAKAKAKKPAKKAVAKKATAKKTVKKAAKKR